MFRLNDVKVSNNFCLFEFESPDTNEVKLDPELLSRLQALRELIKRPVIINSGYRSRDHNLSVGGSSGSYHLKGQAADIRVPGLPLEDLFHAVFFCGFRGVICYEFDNFIHLDVRSVKYINAPLKWKIDAKCRNLYKT